MQTIFNNKGVSLVVLIVIMLGIGLIGGGVASIMMSKQKSYPFALNSFKAYEIANAGIECTIAWVQDTSNPNKGLLTPVNNLTISFGGGTFSTVISGTSPNEILTSTGTFNNVSRVVTLTNFSTYIASSSSSGDVNFDTPADMADSFVPMESQSGQAIAVNPTTGVISLGQGATETFGAIWYGGNNATGNCVNGSCDFGSGFRAYFVFQFATGSTGDGFTFAIINGTNNTASSVGGDTSMGELMAFGGDSRKYDSSSPYTNDISLFADNKGLGIKPPKFAAEFDIYINGCGTVCSGAGSRCDSSDQHMAYVFWGDNNTMGCAPEDVSIYLRWMPSMSYAANTIVHPTTPNGYIYRTLNTGTSSATQPVWPAGGSGGTVKESGGLQWQEVSWRQNTNYSFGDIIAPTTVSCSFDPTAANGHFYTESRSSTRRSCVTCGFFCSEPDWTGCTGGGTCNDNAARWQDANLTVAFPGNSRTYDDNRHTAGSGGDNGSSSGTGPTNTTSSGSYYTSPTNPAAWLADTGNPSVVNPKYAYRMEVVRNSGTRTYTIRSWVRTCTDGTTNCDMYTNGAFGNVSTDYDRKWTASTVYSAGTVVSPTTANGHYYICTTAGTSGSAQPAWPTTQGATVANGSVVWTEYGPFLERAITLDATYNTAFNKFLFGWTVATGAATQVADVRKFRMSFKP